MHAQNIFAFLALAVVAMSAALPAAAVPAPNAGSSLRLRSGSRWIGLTLSAEIVRKSEASADDVDITQIGDGY